MEKLLCVTNNATNAPPKVIRSRFANDSNYFNNFFPLAKSKKKEPNGICLSIISQRLVSKEPRIHREQSIGHHLIKTFGVGMAACRAECHEQRE